MRKLNMESRERDTINDMLSVDAKVGSMVEALMAEGCKNTAFRVFRRHIVANGNAKFFYNESITEYDNVRKGGAGFGFSQTT